ncbi:hypothetical protein [Chitinophaga sp. CF118]|uniref:hypothetical protein n=1 Tax=Chitinophaga sp. CF118 TaxID=1884367 RepID=UPI0011609AFF|nr:hypothetical protein [Chitinophaga sp. CF118]
MAKQNSIIALSGRLGNQVYYYRKDKKNRKQYLVRRAPDTVQQTTATKRAATDFGIASKSSRLIRNSLREYTQHCYDNTLHYRLNTMMGKILRADGSHPAGRRMLIAANMQLLKDFQFNRAASIHQLLKATPVIEKNDQGDLILSFPGTFTSSSNALRNVTHLSIKAIGLSVNFTKHTTRQVIGEATIIKRGEKYSPITLKLDPDSRNITLILLEVQSLYEVNGHLHLSQNKTACVLDVMAIIPPQEQPKEVKKQYRNKAPRLWTIPPYPVPASILRSVVYNSLPEG